MKLIIAGSRSITDYEYTKTVIDTTIRNLNLNVTEVVSGGAKGIDTLGERWAKENNIKIKTFCVSDKDWKKLGKKAGNLRNQQMAKYGDFLISIWNGESKGTLDMRNKILVMHKSMVMYSYPNAKGDCFLSKKDDEHFKEIKK